MASEQEKLDEMLELTRENNKILRKMHRGMIWSQIFTFLYWMVILGVMGASYYYLQPYITKYWGLYQSAVSTLEQIKETGSTLTNDIDGIVKPR